MRALRLIGWIVWGLIAIRISLLASVVGGLPLGLLCFSALVAVPLYWRLVWAWIRESLIRGRQT